MYSSQVYIANPDHTIGYSGNKLFRPIKKLQGKINAGAFERRPQEIRKDEMWSKIASVNNAMNLALHDYFKNMNSVFVQPPLTTRILSSPKAIYSKEATNEAPPLSMKWFNSGDIFLSQSTQLYMELYLTSKEVNSAYCLTTSFRGETSDSTHLSEFHMIEYEGKISQKENKKVIGKLITYIIKWLIKNNANDLSFFLSDDDIKLLKHFANSGFKKDITFEQALDELYMRTKEKKYKEFTTKHFGSWEEVLLSSELGPLIVSQFPSKDAAFYQARLMKNKKEVAETADFIWPTYREVAGGGHRARNSAELLKYIKLFNLPIKDYRYYLESRNSSSYEQTAGFGMGWERIIQAILKMPYIYSASAFPRVNSSLHP